MSNKPLYLRVQDGLIKAWKYWPWPMNPATGRPVTAFMANVMFREALPGSAAQLLTSQPGGSIVPTPEQTEGLQGAINQGNESDDYVTLGGYTQIEFPRAETVQLVSVINTRELDYYNQGKKTLERIESMPIQTFLSLIAVPLLTAIAGSDQARALFCQIAATCGLSVTPNSFTIRHFQTTKKDAGLSAPLYRGSIEYNECDGMRGWFANTRDPNTPQVLWITVDGVRYQQITVSVGGRVDVRDALTGEGAIGVTSDVFGFRFDKPATYRDGLAHKWGVEGEVSPRPIQVNYLVNQTITCAAPTDPNTPYPIQQLIKVASSLTKGGAAIIATITERMSNGTTRDYAGSAVPVWSLDNAPGGFTLTPNDANRSLSLLALGSATVDTIRLKATIGTGAALPADIQVISVECQRPPGLTTYGYSYNFIPTNGNARLFDTLDDANNTAGRKFDGTVSGDFGTLYQFQVGELKVGQAIYIVNGTGNCEKVSDGILYVLDSAYGNTVRKAIQVVGGVIIAIKDSTYQAAPSCTVHPKLTQTQYDAYSSTFPRLYERKSVDTPARSFASKAELLQYIQNDNQVNIDLFGCTTTDFATGSVVYNANNTRPNDPESYQYPVEAGFWGYNRVLPTNEALGSLIVIQTNACGDIVSRETVTLYLP